MDGIAQTTICITPDGRLTRRQAARFLGVAERTLANWRSRRCGPPQIKIGGKVFYRLSELQLFVGATG
ncbi:helix-turn-helix transcriptional regulator [Novosphingobium subterraneum]|uniref:helix-turn-helix transcriptional regulator n=1 Tax=Novosphingobium subterraneum TaxID=48936 RepID=UPI003CFD908B